MRRYNLQCFVLIAILIFASGARSEPPSTPVRFSRDILPILSENCFKCHGPDDKARKAKLRLDQREAALKVLSAGKPGESELLRRINAEDDDGLMPPPKSNRKLTAEQKQTLRRWIEQGAVWGKHWAYETPGRPALSVVKDKSWPKNGIDYFVLALLEKVRLAHSPEASKETLIRRVTLDLTGLPPSLKEVDAFLADRSVDAYEKVVDRLLTSERFGERMAMEWLDEARYADTNGYQNDFARTMWPWRDWVIGAFNRNLPFDRFITEQLAGDLLPGATLQQKIATGFNRNNRTVTEAGSIEDEWLVENVVDRVETTATVFLGLTMGCARCHEHKYDPISQKEFYEFFAFFNNVNEKGVYTEQRGNVAPLLAVPSKEDEEKLKEFDLSIATADKSVREQEAGLAERQKQWEETQRMKAQPPESSDWALRLPLAGDLKGEVTGGKTIEATFHGNGKPTWTDSPFGKALKLEGQIGSYIDAAQAIKLDRLDRFSYGGWVMPRDNGTILSKMDDAAAYRGFDLLVNENKVQVHLVNSWPGNAIKVFTQEPLPLNVWSHVFSTYDSSSKAAGVKIYVNGRSAKLTVEQDRLKDTVVTPQPLRIGQRSTAFPFKGELADIRIFRQALSEKDVQAIADQAWTRIVHIPSGQRTKPQQELLAQIFRDRHAEGLQKAKQATAKARQAKTEYQNNIPTVMIMEDRTTPRETYLLKRGRYEMPDKTQKVQPGVPACFPPLPAGAPRNRLGLAKWLVDPSNPLTSRVTVNRFWQQFFGIGLVKTGENFGLQSEPPSNPELLDWLATEFSRIGWDVKAMQKLLVMSATYRQSSKATTELVQRDPENRLLARGPRFRLPAEVVRDNALAISGLLVNKVGGPPIRPYQPAGLWEDLAGGAGEAPYVQDKGPNLYRRSLYIYRKRTVPHPVMSTFDAPSREFCQVQRPRTNTPLQALELLNDVTYVEAARALAQRMLGESGNSPAERLSFAFRRATARTPTAAELQLLTRSLEKYQKRYQADVEGAKRFVRVGETLVDERLNPAELAAYTAIAGVILNLDETITKE